VLLDAPNWLLTNQCKIKMVYGIIVVNVIKAVYRAMELLHKIVFLVLMVIF